MTLCVKAMYLSATKTLGRRSSGVSFRWLLCHCCCGGSERVTRGRSVPRWVSFSIALIGVVVAVGAMVQIVLVGHSGAKAVWAG